VSDIILLDPSQFVKTGFTTNYILEVLARISVADVDGAVLSFRNVDTGDLLAIPGPVVSDTLAPYSVWVEPSATMRIALFCESITGGGTLYCASNINVSYAHMPTPP